MGSKLIPVSQEPRLLKDFLKENSQSFSSINFQHKKTFFEENLNATLFSSKSLSKFFVKAVKYLPFASIKSPSILPRSISRRLSNNPRRNNLHGNVDVKEISVKVKVKDILRWRSFRDLADDQSPPWDFSSSPHHCTTVTTTTGSTSTTTSSSRSSWCDSDFTAEDLRLWCSEEEGYPGETEVQKGKKLLSLGGVGRESVTVQPKVEWPCEEEKEQNRPVSVLDFSFQEDEESFSFFHQTPTNLKPKKMQRKGLFMSNNSISKEETNGVELKAMQLLNHAKGTSFVESYEDLLLLDFFSEELSTSNKQKGDAFDCELLRVAKAWISGEDDGCLEWKMVGKREFSVRDMERGIRWNKFEDDEQELSLEMENLLLNYLVDELLLDFNFLIIERKFT